MLSKNSTITIRYWYLDPENFHFILVLNIIKIAFMKIIMNLIWLLNSNRLLKINKMNLIDSLDNAQKISLDSIKTKENFNCMYKKCFYFN